MVGGGLGELRLGRGAGLRDFVRRIGRSIVAAHVMWAQPAFRAPRSIRDRCGARNPVRTETPLGA
jgi:hypothetical protein